MKKLLISLMLLFPFSVLALSFDGVNDYVDAGDNSNLMFERTLPFSGCAWIYPKALSGTPQFLGKILAVSPFTGWNVDYTSVLRSVLVNSAGGVNNYIQRTSVALTLNTWTHICFTYTGSSAASGIQHYVNGVAQSMTTSQDNLTLSILTSANFQIGARNGTNNPFNGLIDEVRVYNRALTAAEIRSLFYGQAVRSSLVGYWPLIGATSGTFEPDFSGLGNHGTRTNGPYRSALSFFNRFRR